MIQPELLTPKGDLPDALTQVIVAEHLSALSIFNFMGSFNEQLAGVTGNIDLEAEQLYAGIQHCVTVGNAANKYLRVAHSLSARYVPIAEEGSEFSAVANTTASTLRRIRQREELPLDKLYSSVCTLFLPKLICQAKDLGVPPSANRGDSKMPERISQVKELASFMGNLVIAPAITASRELFLASLDSGIDEVRSPEMLAYFRRTFDAATITTNF